MRHPILTKQRHERELSEIALKIVHIGEDRRREKRSTKNKDENQSSTKKPCHSNEHDKEFTLSLIDFVKKAHPLTTIERDLAPCSKRNLLLLVKWILEWGERYDLHWVFKQLDHNQRGVTAWDGKKGMFITTDKPTKTVLKIVSDAIKLRQNEDDPVQ